MLPLHLTEIVDRALATAGRVVLAVSGGVDSMSMLSLASRSTRRAHVMAVATFDHGTGPAASEAAALVEREATRLGFDVECGTGASGKTEAEWRAARWTFLRGVADARGARVATAHTLDDQVETVCMRILRGSGARGLAGLLAESDIVRPLLAVHRAALERWARAESVMHCEDPTNQSRDFLRNRVRLELLPAIDGVAPQFRDELRAIGERAAEWRRDVEALAGELPVRLGGHTLVVSRVVLEPFDRTALGVLWPALAARAGVVLDRRGTDRLTAFTLAGGRTGGRIQLSGGIEVIARRDEWKVRRTPGGDEPVAEPAAELVDGTSIGGWRFLREVAEGVVRDDHMRADLPADVHLVVRAWQAGDRMRRYEGGALRRVKRFLSDARIAGPERSGWPVVLAGDEIVWIPGVSRSDAATVRSGRPALRFACERTNE